MYDLPQNFHLFFSLHFINNILTLAHPTSLPLPMAHINLSLNCQADSKPYWKAAISFGRRGILTAEVHIETRKRKQGTKSDLGFYRALVQYCHLNTFISIYPAACLSTQAPPLVILHILNTTPAKTVRSNMPSYWRVTQSRSEHSKFTFTESSCSRFLKVFKKRSVQQIKVEEVSPPLWILITFSSALCISYMWLIWK